MVPFPAEAGDIRMCKTCRLVLRRTTVSIQWKGGLLQSEIRRLEGQSDDSSAYSTEV